MPRVIIHQFRKEKGWSQSQLAKVLNISPSTVGMYEQERRTPDLEMLITLSRLFNVSLNYLITGAEFKKTNPSATIAPLNKQICYCKNCAVLQCPCFQNR